MTMYGGIMLPHQHSFIVSEGVRICSTCGSYPNEGVVTVTMNSTVPRPVVPVLPTARERVPE